MHANKKRMNHLTMIPLVISSDRSEAIEVAPILNKQASCRPCSA
jgi:hypothetical protein